MSGCNAYSAQSTARDQETARIQVFDMNSNANAPPGYTGLIRRLMAIIYDLFLLIALLFIATSVAMIFNNGQAIEPGNPLYPFYIIYLLTISFVLNVVLKSM